MVVLTRVPALHASHEDRADVGVGQHVAPQSEHAEVLPGKVELFSCVHGESADLEFPFLSRKAHAGVDGKRSPVR